MKPIVRTWPTRKEVVEYTIKIFGHGGDGVVLLLDEIAKAVVEGEMGNVLASPSFGPERSGAPVTGTVRIGERLSPAPVTKPDAIIVFRSALKDQRIFDGCGRDTLVILDSIMDPKKAAMEIGHETWCLDATGIAMEIIKKPLPGAALFGAFVKIAGIVEFTDAYEAVRTSAPPELVKQNIEAFCRGYRDVHYSGYVPPIVQEMAAKLPSNWRQLPYGAAILEAGNSVAYHTGNWGTKLPRVNDEKCILCAICCAMCPDDSIRIREGKLFIDTEHCKGCGICAEVCPDKYKAIAMVPKEEI